MPEWWHRDRPQIRTRSAGRKRVAEWPGHNPDMADDTHPTIDPVTPAVATDEADTFDDLVFAAVEALPATFRNQLGSVAIVVEDEATPYQLAAVGAQGLLGLYTGVPRTAWGADGAPAPSKITIFRLPHLRQFSTPESLRRGVAETVRHEVAHHFGISDARLDELARESHGR
jgi:predicted Zn-dependent protease with MMP-like domain